MFKIYFIHQSIFKQKSNRINIYIYEGVKRRDFFFNLPVAARMIILNEGINLHLIQYEIIAIF